MPRIAAWAGPPRRPWTSRTSRQRRARASASLSGPPHHMRDHPPAEDFEPGERTAIGARNARIDAREATAVQNLDTLQIGRVADDQPLCPISGKHSVELLVYRQMHDRCDLCANFLGVGVAPYQPAVPQRPQRVVK